MLVKVNELAFQNPSGFIVLEGINGGGKSTLLNKINSYIQEKNLESICTREPGAGELGTKIRKLIFESNNSLDPLTETCLFLSDRREHVKKIIEPALKAKQIVLSDRYYYSTIVFQGYGRNLDIDMLIKLNHLIIEDTIPDLIILLDLDPEVGLRRTQQRKDNDGDSFEKEALEFHKRLRFGFLDIANNFPEKFFVLDAEQDQETLWNNTKPVIDQWLACLK